MAPPSDAAALERIAGVRPSDEWLAACRLHLQETNQPETEDAILHQILHADLRDVVGRSSGQTLQQDESESSSPQHQLRRAIQTSLHTGKASLPSNFRLLVQVEEVLDVSVNAETRLSVGPANRTTPTPVGNQYQRCLKLYISDGYDDDMTSTTPSQPPQKHLIAMEIPPLLSDLSVHSHAGLKVLLKGVLEVRWGILQWHAGNATVLGGSVASLIEIQKKALQQAQRVAGVGVDPTIKALIWNPLTGMEEEQDEGEQQSGDVVAAPVAAVPPAALQQAMPPPSTQVSVARNSQRTTTQAISASSSTRQTGPLPPATTLAAQPASTGHTTLTPTTSLPNTRALAQGLSSSREISSTSSSTAGSNPYANPYSQQPQRPMASTISSSRGRTQNHAPRIIDPAVANSSQETIDLVTPTNETDFHDMTSSVAVGNHNNAETSAALTTPSATLQHQPLHDIALLSFSELKTILQQARTNETLYRQYEHQVMAVPCKVKGNHRFFNILKKKKRVKDKKKDKEHKYEYVMDINLAGPSEADGTLTAHVSSDLLLDYFALKPREMRQLSREDRPKSRAYISEGGNNFMADLKELASWQLTMMHPADEFFHMEPTPELDGATSIVRLIRRHGAN